MKRSTAEQLKDELEEDFTKFELDGWVQEFASHIIDAANEIARSGGRGDVERLYAHTISLAFSRYVVQKRREGLETVGRDFFYVAALIKPEVSFLFEQLEKERAGGLSKEDLTH